MFFKSVSSVDDLIKKSESLAVNKDISEILRELASLRGDLWKSTAYTTAANSIENLGYPITNITDFTKITGVGNDISKEILEYLETGTIKKLDKLREKEESNDLKFSRNEALELTKNFFKLADKNNLKYEVCGSIRREKQKVKDVDLVALDTQFNDWISLANEISSNIRRSGSKEIDFEYNGIDINIRSIPKEEWGAGVLYFTGPNNFSVFMRKSAKEKGFKLNRHGLFDSNGKRIAISEMDIFDKLGIPYKEPNERG